ncbi:FAD:protein FMN transferase [Serpentinicella alkaliphila]|uniref:FAD:protein FMN transferase n=1 Tax=Serpentinicella alkaliphila TaxID=1734049 RepID=A0A4R2T1E5_9FIRM|nr:FAD:protein FMN transferase [Serpentinicella alkaliphila]QUH26388.1 FAD:protein FMN transferase [Serpentinicella alkaliphila]TCP94936.1 thiamine biosynthesis lipoprotein ApbE [Serpentinicella alkaliphila]
MKKISAILFCIIFIMMGCNIGNKSTGELTSRRKISYDHFGTVSSVIVFDDFSAPKAIERFESTWQEINNMLEELDKAASVSIPESDIYRFNMIRYEESIEISPLTAELIKISKEMYEFTNGKYNPAVYNLVDLWGFTPRFNYVNQVNGMPYDRNRNDNGSFNLPDNKYIEAFRELSDFAGVILSGNDSSGYILTKNINDIEIDGVLYSLKIDLGGIAKGYAADKAIEILKMNGYEYGFVNVGLSSLQLLKRNVSNKGAPDDNMWGITVSNPNNKTEKYLTIFDKNTGISTSGTYDLSYFLDGREYSHIINPYTGEPTTSSILAVSILGNKSSEADAISTALCTMAEEEAIDFMNTYLDHYKVALIIMDGKDLKLVTNMKEEDYIVH